MGKPREDLTGRVFGRWTVIGFAHSIAYPSTRSVLVWLCRCECGAEKGVNGRSLRQGQSKSCGCLMRDSKRTHGMSHTRLYGVWVEMIQRCTNSAGAAWRYYGGRGIQVCQRWRESFESFYEDMGAGYVEGQTTIDRINNNGNYEPGNCRWATHAQQARNTRRNRNVLFKGRRQTITDWASELGLNRFSLNSKIVQKRIPVDRAIKSLIRQREGMPDKRKRALWLLPPVDEISALEYIRE